MAENQGKKGGGERGGLKKPIKHLAEKANNSHREKTFMKQRKNGWHSKFPDFLHKARYKKRWEHGWIE